MSHEWDSGFMTRLPSWHHKENAVLKESPRSWPEARKAAGLEWDVSTDQVYRRRMVTSAHVHTFSCPVDCDKVDGLYEKFTPIEGYQELSRDDTDTNLAVQPTSYAVIRNEQFGYLIDALLGLEGDEFVDFEALMSLYGGRSIVALVTFPSPLVMPWDPSNTYTYCGFASRHDGQGGLRGIPTNVRIQCANTFNQAELTDGKRVGFTIRHTANWKERVAEIRKDLVVARGQSQQWIDFTEKLATWNVNARRREAYLKRFLPISDDMSERQRDNTLLNREKIRDLLAGPSCAGIGDNGYGLLMASTEWNDHFRPHRSIDSYVSRQLMRKEPNKAKAALVLADMAGVK
jgi:phage/plasmid-like protein (TIGR03299 family)